jgi:hypothetical protein
LAVFLDQLPRSRCLMRHPIELFQRLLDLSVRAAIVEACTRWPATNPTHLRTTSREETPRCPENRSAATRP